MRNKRRTIRKISVLCGMLCLLLPGVAWSGLHSPLYQQVLDKLQQLTPGNEIAVDIGVAPQNYQEKFSIDEHVLTLLRQAGVPDDLLTKLAALAGKEFKTDRELTNILESTLSKEAATQYGALISQVADTSIAAYDYGDEFEIRFQASQPCYAALMHVAGDSEGGAITFFLPNRQFPEIQLEANQAYSTIQNFNIRVTVGAPPTNEIVNLFCSREKIDWLGSDMGQASYYIISPTDDQRLQNLLDTLDVLEKSEWAGKALEVQIGPKTRAPKKFGAIPPIGATGTTGKGKFFPPIRATGTTGKQQP